MSDWRETKVSDFCNITRGGSPRPIQDFISDNGTPWVKIADAKNDSRYIKSTKEFIKKEGEKKSRVVYPGDFILSNSATPGLPRFMKIRACIHDGWLLLRDIVGVDDIFLYYLLLTERESLLIQGNGSIFTNLKTDILKNHTVILPPLPEQKAIAEVLSSLDDKIDLLHRQNKTLEQMAETLFRQWFVEEAGEDWITDEISNYVEVVDNRGKTPPNSKDKTAFPLIEVNALGKENRLVDYSVIRKYVDEATFDNWFRNKPKKYDTLLSTVGSIGAISMYILEKGNVAQNVIGLTAKDISSFYLFQFLKYRTNEILLLDIGGVQPSIKVPHLLSLDILIPPTELQQAFDSQIIDFVHKMEINYKEIKTLESLRDTLLPKLMSGEIRVAL
jgi:type I restriction enzyme S subunit